MQKRGELTTDGWYDATPLLPPQNKEDIDNCPIFMVLNTVKCYKSRVWMGEVDYAMRTKKKEQFMPVVLEQGRLLNAFTSTYFDHLIIYTRKMYVIEWLPEVVEKEVIPELKRMIRAVEEENMPPTGPCAEAYTLYKQGRYEEALHLYLELGKQGNAEAQYNLGAMYALGQGTAADAVVAAGWYAKAAEQGIVRAIFNLGMMNYEGQGMAVNKEKAAKLFRSCAEAGYMEAQYKLAVMLYVGDGTLEDREESNMWYGKAVGQGCKYAPPAFVALFRSHDESD